MKNIVVNDTTTSTRWEFIHTKGVAGFTDIHLHSVRAPDGHWSLTAEPHQRRPEGDYERPGLRVAHDEEPNSIGIPRVPEHVVKAALARGGSKALYKPW